MGELIDLIAKIKKYYRFSRSELISIIVTVLILGFIISFRDWGAEEVNVTVGFLNLFKAILIVLISVAVHDFAIKTAALSIGLRAEYKMWTFGLIFAILLAFATRGRFWFLIPGGVVMYHLAGHRLGFFRYDINYFGMGFSAFTGPLASLILAIIFKSINAAVQSPILEKAVLFNIVFALWTILPIPPSDGSKLFYGSRMVYSLCLSLIISASVLLIVNIPISIAIFGSIIVSIICWLLYYIYFERIAWKGPYP